MDEEFNKILEHYGANLDDSGEPDEVPQALEDWRKRVASWDARRHDEK